MKTNKKISTIGNYSAFSLKAGCYVPYSNMKHWDSIAMSFTNYGWKDGCKARNHMCIFPPYTDNEHIMLAGELTYRLGVGNYAPLMEVWADPVKYGITHRDINLLIEKGTDLNIYELFDDYINFMRQDSARRRVNQIGGHWYYRKYDIKLVNNELQANEINILLTETSMRSIIKNRLEIDSRVAELDDKNMYGYEWVVLDPAESLNDKRYAIRTNGCWIESGDNIISTPCKYDLTKELLDKIEEHYK